MSNASIILAGQPLDLIGQMDRGTAAGARMVQVREQDRMRNALAQHGAGALQGDQTAVNALAAFDPTMVQGLQRGNVAMDATRQNMEVQRASEGRAAQLFPVQLEGAGLANDQTRQQMRVLDEQNARQVQQHLASMTAAEREAEIAADRAAIQQLIGTQSPEQWDALAASLGQPEMVGGFENRQSLLYGLLDAEDIAADLREREAQGPTFRQATPEEAAGYGATAGQFDTETGRFYPNNPPSSMRVETRPDGTMVMVQGAQGDGDRPPEAQPSSPEAMIATIDGILSDPDLMQGVGVRGFANQFLGPLAPNARRVDSRIEQLQGQAFLQAFESLKGGGQITEIEGQKATQAMGRLNTAQSTEDFTTALSELRAIAQLATSRPQGWVNTPAGQAAAATQAVPDAPANITQGAIERGVTQEDWDAMTDAERNLFR